MERSLAAPRLQFYALNAHRLQLLHFPLEIAVPILDTPSPKTVAERQGAFPWLY